MGVVSGIVVGTIIAGIVGYVVTKRNAKAFEEEATEEKKQSWKELTYPLEQKLRNAIYECERDANKCADKITEICGNQLDLVQDVGKISHIEVKNKPLFFEFYNPVTGKRFFYYERDLKKDNNPEVLEKIQKLLKKYTKQIELLNTQRDFFLRLIDSHNENLNRVQGIDKQSAQLNKINEHEIKLSEMNAENKIEENAIYNDLLLKEINEELEYQEECMRQYIELNEKYENPSSEKVEEKFKLELNEIIKHLEDKNPER